MSTHPIDLADAAALAELAALINTCEQAEPLLGRQVAPQELPAVFSDPTAFREEGLVWRADAGAAEAVGYLRWFQVGAGVNADLRVYVHPRLWGTQRPDEVLGWAAGRVAALAAEQGRRTTFYSDCLPDSPWRAALLEAHGLRPMRYFYGMERSLRGEPPAFAPPQGYSLRTLAAPDELPAWVALFNRAYHGQWNAVPTTVDIQADLRADARYQPEHDLVAVGPAGELAGFCLGFVLEPAGLRAGWVLELGCEPSLRGRGLGRAMLSEALRRFQAAGLGVARLAVDGANPSGARRLYESLGFEPFSGEVLYGRVLGE